MSKKWLILSTGFALFSMFFGSGNLVFPITVGQESEGHYALASLGIILTGVAVPFLGVFGMMLYEGDIDRFFRMFGKKGAFIFTFCALGLMGPFGVLARCLTVAHGALLLLFPNISLPVASLGFCVVIYFLAINQNRIVTILGSILTPFLLVAIGVIGFFGLKNGVQVDQVDWNGFTAFKNGFFQGYQTMDLLAAFFFSHFVLKICGKKVLSKAALIGAGILSFVYFVLVLLGSLYAPLLSQQLPQEMLGAIALETLGSMAAPCVCVAVIFACITTMIALTSLFAEFLKERVACDKIGSSWALLITLTIGFFISTLEFSGIARFLGPILETIYPALIGLTLFNIGSYWWPSLKKALKILPNSVGP